MIGNRHQAFTRHVDFYTEFTNLYGLAKGAKVQVAGMDGGQILEVGIPDSPASKFRVRLRIDEKLHGLVRTDSIATIGTEGVVGNTFLSISSGSPQAPAAAAQTTLSSKEPTEIADLLDRAKGMISDIDSTVRNANGVVTTVGTNLNSTLGSVKTAVSNVNDIVVGLKEGQGPAGMFLRDRALEGKIRQTLTNAQEATANLRRASAQVDTLTSDIQSRQFPLKIDETLARAKDAASNFDATSQQVHQTVDEFSGPDAQGITAGINLRESLSNVNAATGNLADDTEALKHNFFFRPFFDTAATITWRASLPTSIGTITSSRVLTIFGRGCLQTSFLAGIPGELTGLQCKARLYSTVQSQSMAIPSSRTPSLSKDIRTTATQVIDLPFLVIARSKFGTIFKLTFNSILQI
jgi:phospholipid/cholesterol/gamma-HCH transport system substrate-binding protein